MRKENTQRPTSNFERRTSLKFGVSCWTFGVLFFLILPTSKVAAQQAAPPPGSPPGPPAAPGGAAPAGRPPMRPAPPERVHLVTAPQGNEARYRVREQLASFDFPSDAVGATQNVTGGLLVALDGKVVPDSSRFDVDLRTLASNEPRRDRFLQRNTLKTDSFPQISFVPTAVKDLSRAPTSVPASFQLAGNLTVHGVTKPSVWDVTVKQAGQEVVGTATTSFAFSDFGLEVPKLAMLLSVKDTIHLEYDFHLVRAPS